MTDSKKKTDNDNKPAKTAKLKVRVKTVNGKLTEKHYKATMKALHGKFGRTQ